MKEWIVVDLWHRFRRLLEKMLSLTFLTWCYVSFLYWYNKQQVDINYLLFTTAVALGKSYIDLQKGKGTWA